VRVEEILSQKGPEVVTASPGSLVPEVMRLLVQRNIGCAVVAEAGRVLGILTERDFLRLAVRDRESLRTSDAAGVMTTPVLVADPADPVPWVMERMARHRIRHLPVVAEGRLVGMVSLGDLVKRFVDHVEAESQDLRSYVKVFLEEPPQRSMRARLAALVCGPGHRARRPGSARVTASGILCDKGARVVSVPPGTAVLGAMEAMVGNDIGSVLILCGGAVRGILTERDVLKVGAGDLRDLERLDVDRVMSRKVVVGAPEDSLATLMGVMTRNRIRHLPIVAGGALEGILSMRDVLQALVGEATQHNHELRERVRGRRQNP
jgi:CBS domain-containing protein